MAQRTAAKADIQKAAAGVRPVIRLSDDAAVALMPAWVATRGPDADVVFTTRVRLARNVPIAPFPGRATLEDLALVAEACRAPFEASPDFADFRLAHVASLDAVARRTLVERHLLSTAMAEYPEHRLAVISPTGTISVMINEEDHVRMQCFLPGRDLKEAWRILDGLDDWLSGQLSWCYSPRYGYLTTHLANLGTGLRASAMLHLPALHLIGKRDETLQGAAHLGVAVRGLYGEGSESAGDVFQVSNRFALGPSEEDIISRVDSTARYLISAEREARNELLEKDEEGIADAAGRAYGILRYAKRISTSEAMLLLSRLKLGLDLKLLNTVRRTIVQQLFILVQPASLQAVSGRVLDAERRDRARADLIREALSSEK